MNRKESIKFQSTYIGEDSLNSSTFAAKSDEEKTFISNDIEMLSRHFKTVRKDMPSQTIFARFRENEDTFIFTPATNFYGAEKSFRNFKATVKWCNKDARKNRCNNYCEFRDNIFFRCYMRELRKIRRNMLLKWLGALTPPAALFFGVVNIIEWIGK